MRPPRHQHSRRSSSSSSNSSNSSSNSSTGSCGWLLPAPANWTPSPPTKSWDKTATIAAPIAAVPAEVIAQANHTYNSSSNSNINSMQLQCHWDAAAAATATPPSMTETGAPSASHQQRPQPQLCRCGLLTVGAHHHHHHHNSQAPHYPLHHHRSVPAAAGLRFLYSGGGGCGGVSSAAPTAVRLDLSGARGVRAEVAFTGALEPATSATAAATTATVNGRQQQQQQQQQQKKLQQPLHLQYFVQVQNPLCVPRHSDYLASWRTCMVPIVDLEQFAFMKPPSPSWRHIANRSSAGGSSSVLLFTLMCYNILSDQYTSAKSYWYCPDWALAWSYRRQGILENISACLPSVVCLQEVETEQFYAFFLPHLSRRGYDGVFSPKSRAKTMDDRLRKRVDGCAIFWKRSEFRLVEEHVIEFSQQYLEHCWSPQHHRQQQQDEAEELDEKDDSRQSPPLSGEDEQFSPGSRGQASSEIFNRVTVRDNIALAVVLAPAAPATADTDQDAKNASSGHLMVCTSHIHWDPQYSDVKLIQTVVLTSALAAKIEAHKAATGADSLPLILCGDFNSLPDSGVVEFLNRGSVERDHPEFQRLGCDPSLDGLKVVGDLSQSSFSHSLDLASCYGSVDMAYTNFTHDFKGIIDYIFASRGHFRVLDCLEGMADWLQAESVIGCPHPYVPSDHIPLVVQLEMKLDQHQQFDHQQTTAAVPS